MSNGRYRPNSGRKKGSIPWNKGIPMSKKTKHRLSFAKLGQTAWNKGLEVPSVSIKMKGNTNGSGNKGRVFKPGTLLKMRLAKLGKPSKRKGTKNSIEVRLKISKGKRKSYLKENPNYVYSEGNDRKKVRLNRIRKNGGCHSNAEWKTLKAQYNWTCPCCKKPEPEIKLTRDHIIAVSRGGSDNIENIQPLCVSCNSHKNIHNIKY